MDFVPNHLYYGDCLDVMDSWPDASVDLVYLNPLFNSNATDFGSEKQNAEKSDTVHEALTGVWTWNAEAKQRLKRLRYTSHPVERSIRAAAINLGHSGRLAYLTYIAERLTAMRRILKSTGAIYLHCDSTISHNLKPVMDALFGAENYRNEIIWKPTAGFTIPNANPKNFAVDSNTILFYSMPHHQFKVSYEPDPDAENRYPHLDENNRRFTLRPLWRSPSMDTRPNLNYEWKGCVNPYPSGWFVTKGKLEKLYQNGHIYFRNNRPYRIFYMDENKGKPIGNVWTDINRSQGISREFLGYPGQKPLALLERILEASSSEGALVLDPFCGDGTTIEAGLKLRRQVIGIDVSIFALDAINTIRLKEKYLHLPIKGFGTGSEPVGRLEIQQPDPPQFPNNFKPAALGENSDVIYQLNDMFHSNFEDFLLLVQKERHQFQTWTVQQIGMIPNAKGSHDGGIDGANVLMQVPEDDYKSLALTQVKSGDWDLGDVKAFCWGIENNNAACGVFITMYPIGARSFAHEIAEEFGNVTVGDLTYPRLQLWSIKEFYENGTRPNLPPLVNPYED